MRSCHWGALLSALYLLKPAAGKAASTVTVSINTAVCSTVYPFSSAPSGSPTVIVYTTTDSAGSLITTSSTSFVPFPTGSSTVILFTTTDSAGQLITTSTTSYFPTQTGSGSVIYYTTTDSAGRTITTASTSYGPTPTVVTTAFVSTFTSGGLTFTTTSTGVITLQPSPTGSGSIGAPCPVKLFDQFTSNGRAYEIVCTADFQYNDLVTRSTERFEDCIAECDTYIPSPNFAGGSSCVAVTWHNTLANGDNCYLKYEISQVTVGDTSLNSAKLRSYNPPIGNISVLITTVPVGGSVSTYNVETTTGVSAPTTSPTTTSTTGSVTDSVTASSGTGSLTGSTTGGSVTGGSGPATGGSASATGGSASATGGSASASPSASASSGGSGAGAGGAGGSGTGGLAAGGATCAGTLSSTFPSCPDGNMTLWSPGNNHTDVYQVLCGIRADNYEIGSQHAVNDLQACIADCESYIPTTGPPGTSGIQPCVAASFYTGQFNSANCQLHYNTTQNVTGLADWNSAVKLNCTSGGYQEYGQ